MLELCEMPDETFPEIGEQSDSIGSTLSALDDLTGF